MFAIIDQDGQTWMTSRSQSVMEFELGKLTEQQGEDYSFSVIWVD
jgi:hypothetical protein